MCDVVCGDLYVDVDVVVWCYVLVVDDCEVVWCVEYDEWVFEYVVVGVCGGVVGVVVVEVVVCEEYFVYDCDCCGVWCVWFFVEFCVVVDVVVFYCVCVWWCVYFVVVFVFLVDVVVLFYWCVGGCECCGD